MSPRLDQIFEDVPGLPPMALAGITLDSRRIESGDLFVALSGSRGHRH